jgi:hypothetical protein
MALSTPNTRRPLAPRPRHTRTRRRDRHRRTARPRATRAPWRRTCRAARRTRLGVRTAERQPRVGEEEPVRDHGRVAVGAVAKTEPTVAVVPKHVHRPN